MESTYVEIQEISQPGKHNAECHLNKFDIRMKTIRIKHLACL